MIFVYQHQQSIWPGPWNIGPKFHVLSSLLILYKMKQFAYIAIPDKALDEWMNLFSLVKIHNCYGCSLIYWAHKSTGDRSWCQIMCRMLGEAQKKLF